MYVHSVFTVVASGYAKLSKFKMYRQLRKLMTTSKLLKHRNEKDKFFQSFEVSCKEPEDFDEVAEFVYKYYTKNNPLGQIFSVPEYELYFHDTKRVQADLEHSCTLGCHCRQNGKLVGIAFGSVRHIRGTDLPQLAINSLSRTASPQLRAKIKFDAWMRRDIFEELKAEKIFMMGLGAVHPKFLGRKIMEHLSEPLECLAIKNQCQFSVVLATSKFTQDINKRNPRYNLLREVAYKDYVDPDTGEKPLLSLSKIHTHAQLYYRCLNSNLIENWSC